jgi:hypothetical protein
LFLLSTDTKAPLHRASLFFCFAMYTSTVSCYAFALYFPFSSIAGGNSDESEGMGIG